MVPGPQHRFEGFHRLRQRSERLAVVWTLALMLVAQALFPIQSHTRWAVTEDGRVVELCTLQGTVVVTLTRDGELPAESPAQQDDRTAAMAFSQLLAEAHTGMAHVQPAWLTLQTVEPPPAVIGAPVQRALRQAPIRAPPSLV